MTKLIANLHDSPLLADNTCVTSTRLRTSGRCRLIPTKSALVAAYFVLSLVLALGTWPSPVGAIACALAICLASWELALLRVARMRLASKPLRDEDTTDLPPDSVPAASDPSDMPLVKAASEVIFGEGPHAALKDVGCAIVKASCAALRTSRVALFTIDPCVGAVECECSPDVPSEVTTAFWDLFGNQLTDRERHEAWVQTDITQTEIPGEAAKKVLSDCGVRAILASPIRSGFGASGALVAFYDAWVGPQKEMVSLIDAISAQGSAALSYALALEQNRFLLDDLAGANQQLSVEATLDGLTGLANHRSLQTKLSELCGRGGVHGQTGFSLIMIDVDHFKYFNDAHGHQEGDAALRTVAKIISTGLRQGDFAARYGGEEFALVLSGIGKEGAVSAANRIRRAVSDHGFPKGRLTISLGVSEFPHDGAEPNEIIELSDRALYHAKITGRNRVVAWGDAGSAHADEHADTDTNKPKKSVLVVEPKADGATDGSLEDMLPAQSFEVEVATDCARGGEKLRTRAFDIALVAGCALSGDPRSLTELSAIHPNMPLVIVTDDLSVEESREALRGGASDVLPRPKNPAELPIIIERNLERIRVEKQRLAQKSTGLMMQAIEALVAAIDAKDPHTAGHSQRVTSLALALADQLGISAEDCSALELAARLHDIGKLRLPDSALNKQSPLTDEEWQAMKEHPSLGSKIVGAIDELAYVSTIIRHHHERLDGSGYPDGLRGDAIPLLAQVIAVADAYEAMTSERAHRSPLTPAEALEEIRLHAGAYYATEIVQALENHLVASGDADSAAAEDRAA